MAVKRAIRGCKGSVLQLNAAGYFIGKTNDSRDILLSFFKSVFC